MNSQKLNVKRQTFYEAFCLNRTMKDSYTRAVTLSETKGLSERFFTALRMTRFGVCRVTCTNVLRSDFVCLYMFFFCFFPAKA